MDKQSLKLTIIQQIIACEDEKVLHALKDMLANFLPDTKTVNDELLAALLQEENTSSSPVSDHDIDDLQNSIDEIFG